MLILIHRGWGLLTFPIALFGIAGGVWFADHALGRNFDGVAFAVGLLVAGAVLTLFGLWLNQVRADRLTREYATRRRSELDMLVESGQFNLGHPWPIPTSMAMARQQSDELFAAETEAYRKAQHNRHSLYYIPMQFWGYAALVLAVVCAVSTLFH